MEQPDRQFEHLWPPFLHHLQKVIHEAHDVTGLEWHMVEGYRSQKRQTWLYSQGRTRPGLIVTWKKSPTWHGAGLAADLCPVRDGKLWFSAPKEYWIKMQKIAIKYGLSNPAFDKGDLGHVQWNNWIERVKALWWIKKGWN